jgi:hypothetical protein
MIAAMNEADRAVGVASAVRVRRVRVGQWERSIDEVYGAFYYTNVHTGVAQWERPSEFPDLSMPPPAARASTRTSGPTGCVPTAMALIPGAADGAAASSARDAGAVTTHLSLTTDGDAAGDAAAATLAAASHANRFADESVADQAALAKYIKVPMEAFQKELMKRQARVQMDKAEIAKYYTEGAQDYNIWYGRFTSGGNDSHHHNTNELSDTRCDMVRDCGATKADTWDPKGATHYFCIHFAKGRCTLGSECTFFHRIPTEVDAARFSTSIDCFGRERFHEHRQDMGGTGSHSSDCCTLYVGGVSGANHSNVEGALWRAFAEWGTPKRINYVAKLGVAFVTYNNRLNAEFAKQAMAGQALDGKELLNVRWAFDDPNPKVKIGHSHHSVSPPRLACAHTHPHALAHTCLHTAP